MLDMSVNACPVSRTGGHGEARRNYLRPVRGCIPYRRIPVSLDRKIKGGSMATVTDKNKFLFMLFLLEIWGMLCRY
jgi:hypothetical protein